jgi:hypothetical protein
VTNSFEPDDHPDVDAVWLWFEFQTVLLAEERGHILRAFSLGAAALSGSTLRPHEEQFIGFTKEEIEDFFVVQRGRLELLTMFELLATTEAVLRIEFQWRVVARKKDTLSRRFREIQKTRGNKIRLDEDILVPLKDEGVPISDFRGTLKLRDWLAHGKHWHPKLGRGYTPADVFDVVRAVVGSIPAA